MFGCCLGGSVLETPNDDEDTDEDTVIIELPRDIAEKLEVELPVREPRQPTIAPEKGRQPPFESP